MNGEWRTTSCAVGGWLAQSERARVERGCGCTELSRSIAESGVVAFDPPGVVFLTKQKRLCRLALGAKNNQMAIGRHAEYLQRRGGLESRNPTYSKRARPWTNSTRNSLVMCVPLIILQYELTKKCPTPSSSGVHRKPTHDGPVVVVLSETLGIAHKCLRCIGHDVKTCMNVSCVQLHSRQACSLIPLLVYLSACLLILRACR